MTAIVSMLRGVNVGGHNQVRMEDLRKLCHSLGLKDAQTYVQSGNVVFQSKEKDLARLGQKIEDALEKKYGFRPGVMLRTAAEMKDVVARNPFAKRRDIENSKLVVTFLGQDPGAEMRAAVEAIKAHPEEVRMDGREVYIYYPDGMGRSKLVPVLERALKKSGTARNWNTVTRLLEMAEKMGGVG
jgi:uncharacterized protein (DUF1697 family)